MDFGRILEQSLKEQEFIAKNNSKYWSHGGPKLLRFVDYHTFEESPSNAYYSRGCGKTAEVYCAPRIELKRLGYQNYKRGLSSLDELDLAAETPPPTASTIYPEDTPSPFLGLFQIPNFLFSRTGMDKTNFSLDAYSFQTHFEVGEVTYMFGGLQHNPALALKQLGIPRLTDAAKISVYFPVDLPPFMERKVFELPHMAQNTDYIKFNPLRGTIWAGEHESKDSGFLGQLCQARGTLVTPWHVLYCGGFEIVVDSVTHDTELGRWIVKKSIRLNPHGYLLDVRTDKFVQIDIKLKLDLSYQSRLGCSLVSSFYDRRDLGSPLPVPVRSSLPLYDRSTPDESRTEKSSIIADSGSLLSTTGTPVTRLKISTDVGRTDSLHRSKSDHQRKTPPVLAASVLPTSKMTLVLLKSTKILHKLKPSRQQGQIHNLYLEHVKLHRQQVSRPSSPQQNVVRLPPSGGEDSERLGSPKIYSPKPILTAHNFLSLDGASMGESVDSNRQFHLGNSALKSGVMSVSVFQFGGFKLHTSDSGHQYFTSTNELLKMELLIEDVTSCRFHNEALVSEITTSSLSDLWPSPRGFFAFTLAEESLVTASTLCMVRGPGGDFDLRSPTGLALDLFSLSERSIARSARLEYSDQFLDGRFLVVHGGVNDQGTVFSDLFFFSFSTSKWQQVPSFAYDYFENPKEAWEDEEISKMEFENQVPAPKLQEAELRICHHHILTYKEDDLVLLVVLGGFTNQYLRHFDKEPYKSDKLDISRYLLFALSSPKRNLIRSPVLNLGTQLWKFNRVFFDVSEEMSPHARSIFYNKDYLASSHVCVAGGAISLVGRQITLCHGLMYFVTQKASDFGRFEAEQGVDACFVGAHTHITFPSM